MANFDVDTTQQTLSGITPALVTYYSPDATWTFIDWVRSITSLPIVLKGILRPDDAREALKHDIQGIIVSNHGGRRLDTLPASVSYIILLRPVYNISPYGHKKPIIDIIHNLIKHDNYFEVLI